MERVAALGHRGDARGPRPAGDTLGRRVGAREAVDALATRSEVDRAVGRDVDSVDRDAEDGADDLRRSRETDECGSAFGADPDAVTLGGDGVYARLGEAVERRHDVPRAVLLDDDESAPGRHREA